MDGNMNGTRNLCKIKKDYNYNLGRNSKAEIYFKEKSIEECLKQIGLLNEITVKLSNLQNEYKRSAGVDMTKEERVNGFK